MINNRIQIKLSGWPVIALCACLVAAAVAADSAARGLGDSYDLPEIKHQADIRLENLFGENGLEQAEDGLDPETRMVELYPPIQLVGTMIRAQARIAWIKTGELGIQVLAEKQAVAGTQLRVYRIFTDSVELVNTDNCRDHSECRPDIELHLN